MAKDRDTARKIIRGMAAEKLQKPVKPDLSEISALFIQQLGGPEAFAKMLSREFHAAAAGSSTRQKIVASILQWSSTGKDDTSNLGQMTDDELMAGMEDTIERYMDRKDAAAAHDPGADPAAEPAGPEAEGAAGPGPVRPEEAGAGDRAAAGGGPPAGG
jgi:hypothetical protein